MTKRLKPLGAGGRAGCRPRQLSSIVEVFFRLKPDILCHDARELGVEAARLRYGPVCAGDVDHHQHGLASRRDQDGDGGGGAVRGDGVGQQDGEVGREVGDESMSRYLAAWSRDGNRTKRWLRRTACWRYSSYSGYKPISLYSTLAVARLGCIERGL